jgi:hypothetical protein
MNAIATRPAGGTVAHTGLMPRSFDDAMRLAEMIAQSELVPQHLQRKPADCLLVVEQAMRWNMSPFAVAQGTFVTKGKLGFLGTLMHAAVEQNAPVQGHLSYEFTGDGEERTVTVSGVLIGETKSRTVSVKLRDARTTNEWWKTTPDQMLCYHGARVWARRHTPGVIFGAYSREELVDAMEEMPAEAPREVPNLHVELPLKGELPSDKLPVLDTHGNLHQVVVGRWLEAVNRALAKLESASAVRGWRTSMQQHLAAAHAKDADMALKALRLTDEREADLTCSADEPEEELAALGTAGALGQG